MEVKLLEGEYTTFEKLITMFSDEKYVLKNLEKREKIISIHEKRVTGLSLIGIDEFVSQNNLKVCFIFDQRSETPYFESPMTQIGDCEIRSQYFQGNGGFYYTTISSNSIATSISALKSLKPLPEAKKSPGMLTSTNNQIDPRVDSLLNICDGFCQFKLGVEESVHETYISVQELLSVISIFLKNGSRQHFEALYQVLEPQV